MVKFEERRDEMDGEKQKKYETFRHFLYLTSPSKQWNIEKTQTSHGEIREETNGKKPKKDLI